MSSEKGDTAKRRDAIEQTGREYADHIKRVSGREPSTCETREHVRRLVERHENQQQR